MSLMTLDTEHARFNATKTFATTVASKFETKRFGALLATRDPARSDPYYNRVLGLSGQSLAGFGDAVEWITTACGRTCALRVEVNADTDGHDEIQALGFEVSEEVAWLRSTPAQADRSSRARELSPADWPALRQLLEHHGSINDKHWQTKRVHLCTNTFRWFAIDNGPQLVSAASLWTHRGNTILGSAFTVAEHRNNGSHTDLLTIRLAQPATHHFVDVEPDSTSHRNCLRAGFEPFLHRVVYVKS